VPWAFSSVGGVAGVLWPAGTAPPPISVIVPAPRAAAAEIGAAGRACRLTVTVPDVGRSSPVIMRMVVDLPAPLGPRNPVTVPGAIVKLSECTAVVSP
jgi:hypothetical protein